MIPKKIHYCWFGKSEIPKEFESYISGWKKHMPEYEIIRWDESNYDINKSRYMKEAYDARKWGFVPDFARLDILYTYGGIYLDTDVEVIRAFDDLLELQGFIGIDARGVKGFEIQINSGSGMGFEAGNPVLKLLLDEYKDRSFYNENGELDLTPGPNIQTICLYNKLGLKIIDERQELPGVTILPSDYLSPYNDRTGSYNLTDNTHSIHHYAATWADDVERYRAELRRCYCKKYNFLISQVLSAFFAYKKYYGFFEMWPKLVVRIRRAVMESASGNKMVSPFNGDRINGDY